MNRQEINEVIFKIQDKIIKKDNSKVIKLNKRDINYILLSMLFRKIYAFIDVIQHHPGSVALAHSLRPMFEMVLKDVLIPKCISVFDEKPGDFWSIPYNDLRKYFPRRRLTPVSINFYVIECKRQRKKDGVKITLRPWRL